MKGILPVYKDSFFCGFDRADGVQFKMQYEDGIVSGELNLNNRFEGYADVAHGGMLFGVLDVIIWYAIFMKTKKIGMTRKSQMEFFKPVLCNRPYTAKGRFLSVEERDIFAEAWVEDAEGEVYAKMDALFREGKDIPLEDFVNRFDYSRSAPEVVAHFRSLLTDSH